MQLNINFIIIKNHHCYSIVISINRKFIAAWNSEVNEIFIFSMVGKLGIIGIVGSIAE